MAPVSRFGKSICSVAFPAEIPLPYGCGSVRKT